MNDTTQPTASDAVDSDILKIAAEADAAADAQTSPAPAQTEQPTDPATAPADTQAPATPEATPPPTPEHKPADQKPADPKPEDKASPYEKSKKDAERLDRSWKALEQEKHEFRATKAQMEAQLATLQQEVARLKSAPAKPAEPAADRHGLTADDYDSLAKRYADEGRDDMAAVAKDRAAALRAQAATAAQQPRAIDADWTTPDFQAKWQAEVQACLKEDQALADPAHPVTKAANLLVNNPEYGPMFRSSPKGIRYAVEVARLMNAAHAAQTEKQAHEATKAELAKAKAEVDRLHKLMQPQRSHPTSSAPVAKPPEDMSTDDIRALALAADRGD